MARDEAASLRQTLAYVRKRARQGLYVKWRRDGEPRREATVSELQNILWDIDQACERAGERWQSVNHQDTSPSFDDEQ
jgi:hypothetical protein